MRYITYGEVQRRAIAAGLVMSRKPDGVRLRFRDPCVSTKIWDGLGVMEALEIVESVAKS